MKNPVLIKKNIKWGRREKEGVREEKEGAQRWFLPES